MSSLLIFSKKFNKKIFFVLQKMKINFELKKVNFFLLSGKNERGPSLTSDKSFFTSFNANISKSTIIEKFRPIAFSYG